MKLFQRILGGGERPRRRPGSPEELAAEWERLVTAGDEALRRGDVAALARTVEEAAPVRRELVRLDPRAVVSSSGVEGLRRIAALLDDGRAFAWRLVAAAELFAADRAEEARALLAELPPPKIPAGADPALATLLPPLFAVDPALAPRLAGLGFAVWDALELLGASGDVATIEAVGAALEESAYHGTWESHVVQGARRTRRPEVVAALIPVVTRTIPRQPHQRELDVRMRRHTLQYQLGKVRLDAGDGPGALEAWLELEHRRSLVYELGRMVAAGFPDEARRLVEALPEEARKQGRKALADAMGEGPAEGEEDPSAGLRALDRGDAEGAERVLARLRTKASREKGMKKAWSLASAIRLGAALGHEKEALGDLGDLATLASRTRGKGSRASCEMALGIAEIALGHFAEGASRLLRATGEVDHDEAYDRLQEGVEAAERGGAEALEALLAALPEPGDEVPYRERLVAYVAAALARRGEVEKAFAAAETLEDVSRDLAHEYLAMIFVAGGRLEEAERAASAMTDSMDAHRLGEVAAAFAAAGHLDDARRLFGTALARSRNLGSAGRLLVEAALAGTTPEGRAMVASSLGELVGEPDEEELQRWTRAARDEGRAFLSGEARPSYWRRGRTIYEIPEPSTKEPKALAMRARWLAAQGNREEAARLVEEAVVGWLELGASTGEGTGTAQQAESVNVLALAVAELDRSASRRLGGDSSRRGELLAGIRDLVLRIETLPRDNLRSSWRRDVACALGDLGAWKEAIGLAAATTTFAERMNALRWLASSAPLEAFRDGGWTRFVKDDPLRWTFLARLGRDSRAVRRIALRALAGDF